MGYAVAEEAARRGARVVLVSGPSSLEPPANVELIRVRSAAEMHAAVMAQSAAAEIVVMAAAVADYAPAARAGGKIEKCDSPLALDLVRTARHSRRPWRAASPAGARSSSALRQRAATRCGAGREKLQRKTPT